MMYNDGDTWVIPFSPSFGQGPRQESKPGTTTDCEDAYHCFRGGETIKWQPGRNAADTASSHRIQPLSSDMADRYLLEKRWAIWQMKSRCEHTSTHK